MQYLLWTRHLHQGYGRAGALLGMACATASWIHIAALLKDLHDYESELTPAQKAELVATINPEQEQRFALGVGSCKATRPLNATDFAGST